MDKRSRLSRKSPKNNSGGRKQKSTDRNSYSKTRSDSDVRTVTINLSPQKSAKGVSRKSNRIQSKNNVDSHSESQTLSTPYDSRSESSYSDGSYSGSSSYSDSSSSSTGSTDSSTSSTRSHTSRSPSYTQSSSPTRPSSLTRLSIPTQSHDKPGKIKPARPSSPTRLSSPTQSRKRGEIKQVRSLSRSPTQSHHKREKVKPARPSNPTRSSSPTQPPMPTQSHHKRGKIKPARSLSRSPTQSHHKRGKAKPAISLSRSPGSHSPLSESLSSYVSPDFRKSRKVARPRQ
eukprot:515935_1